MRADLVDRFDNAAFRALLQMDALPGDVETFAETVAALRALRDAPVAWAFDYCGERMVWLHKPTAEEFKNITPLYAVPLDTTAGVGK